VPTKTEKEILKKLSEKKFFVDENKRENIM